MEEVSLEPCKWCNGTGRDGDGHYPCFDCESTGYRYGKRADQYFDYLMKEYEKELDEQELLDGVSENEAQSNTTTSEEQLSENNARNAQDHSF